jgi:hypothetical protein
MIATRRGQEKGKKDRNFPILHLATGDIWQLATEVLLFWGTINRDMDKVSC